MYEARDVKAVYDYVKAKQENNIVLYGISMGAATITKAVSEFGLKPSKVILEMPFATLQDAVAGRMRTMGLPSEPLSTLLTFWGGVELGAWAFNYQPQKDAAAINCPVLLQWGVTDPRVTESETHQIFKNLASRDKELIKYLQSGHQSLCKNEKSKWYMTVGRFLMM
jgi:alpha-beta hydrolase superfamily lysophospholipase